MAKILDMKQSGLDELKAKLLAEFTKKLDEIKSTDSKVEFSKSFGTVSQKATVRFSEIAWLKMQALIHEYDKEVGWHGLARRSEDEDFTYLIEDIVVYPQEVSKANITTDQAAYEKWLYSFDDDKFGLIRMHGHSHVTMEPNPSPVDLSFYGEICEKLRGEMFYIFMIWNKSGHKMIKIHDLKHNMLFETADCDIRVDDDGLGVEKLLKEAEDLVKDRIQVVSPPTSWPKSPSTTTNYTPSPGGYGYSKRYNNLYHFGQGRDDDDICWGW